MANVADLNLIQINNFPEVENPSEWIVVSDAAGIGYKISKENFKAFLGTVTVTAPKPIGPADGTPELDGVYIPTVTQNEAGTPIVYANFGGLEVNTAEGGDDHGTMVQFLKNGAVYAKVNTPMPPAENKIPDWTAGTYTSGQQKNHKGQIWAVKPSVSSTTQEPGVGEDWVAKTDKGTIIEAAKTYIFAITDSEGLVLFGITETGDIFIPDSGVPQSILTLLDVISNRVEGADSKIKDLQDRLSITANSEYIFAIADASDRIIFGIDQEGNVVEKTENSNEFVYLIKDSEGKVLFGIRYDNTIESLALEKTIDDKIGSALADYEAPSDSISEDEVVAIIEKTKRYDQGVGHMIPYGSAKSEVKASSVTSDISILDDEFTSVSNSFIRSPVALNRFVAVNHDDLPISDYVSIRKLLNKYNAKANFSYILTLFTNIEEKKLKIDSIKKIIADGNEIIYHAYLGHSSVMASPHYEVKPNGKGNFIPSLTELKPVAGTNYNELGDYVVSTTRFSDIGFINAVGDKAVMSATDSEYHELSSYYTFYHPSYPIYGLDLNDNYVSKQGHIGWTEYWYNELIDSSLGYSTYAGSTNERFIADYDFPTGGTPLEYYPDLSHSKSGKMIFHADIGATTKYSWFAWKTADKVYYTLSASPSVGSDIYLETDLTKSDYKVKSLVGGILTDTNDTEIKRFDYLDVDNYLDVNGYQAVGKFKRGMFKDCFTNRNSEVQDLIFEVTRAVMRHYYDFDNLTGYTMHGGARSLSAWNNGGWKYLDREKSLLQTEATRFFSTKYGSFRSFYDQCLASGMKTIVNSLYFGSKSLEGEVFLYEGQRNIRKSNLYCMSSPLATDLAFLEIYKDDVVGNSNVVITSREEVLDVMGSVDNWARFIIDNADKEVTAGGGAEYTISSDLRDILERMVESFGTGKIPQLTFDTIKDSAGMKVIYELFLQFCYLNDIEIVGYDSARRIMENTHRSYAYNYFPNTSFRQTIKNTYDTVSERSKIPDGFRINQFTEGQSTINVQEKTFEVSGEAITARTFEMFKMRCHSKVYGLQPAKYKFSAYLKGNATIGVILMKNGFEYKKVNTSFTESLTSTASEGWKEVTYEFEIDEFIVEKDGTIESLICDGYHKNISNVHFEFFSTDGTTIEIANPKISTL